MRRACALVLLLLGRMAGQTESSFEGSVTDASGSAVRDANVAVTEVRTGAVRKMVTDVRGWYLAMGLEPGSYRILVEMNGFRPNAREGLELRAGDRARINFDHDGGSAYEFAV